MFLWFYYPVMTAMVKWVYSLTISLHCPPTLPKPFKATHLTWIPWRVSTLPTSLTWPSMLTTSTYAMRSREITTHAHWSHTKAPAFAKWTKTTASNHHTIRLLYSFRLCYFCVCLFFLYITRSGMGPFSRKTEFFSFSLSFSPLPSLSHNLLPSVSIVQSMNTYNYTYFNSNSILYFHFIYIYIYKGGCLLKILFYIFHDYPLQ